MVGLMHSEAGRYHVYGDKGIDYDVSLTRCDEAGVFVERYRICVRLLPSSPAPPFPSSLPLPISKSDS